MNQVTVVSHPLVQHNLTKLRDHRTGPEEFRRGLGLISSPETPPRRSFSLSHMGMSPHAARASF